MKCKACGYKKKNGAIADDIFYCSDCIEAEKNRRMAEMIRQIPKQEESVWRKVLKNFK